MTNTRIERLWECRRLALSLAAALGLGALAFLASPDSARADHICQVSPAASYNVLEGSSVTLNANSSGCETINWDLDNDGQYDDESGETITFNAGERDGPGSQIVNIEGVKPDAEEICLPDPELGEICHFEDDFDSASTTVNINNLGPTATFNAPTTPVTTGSTFNISLTNAWDPSSADRDAGFLYAFDCQGDGVFEVVTSNSASCTASNGLAQLVAGGIIDKDSDYSFYQQPVTLDDTTKPTVLDNNSSLEPDRGATGVSRTTNVRATFSEEMNVNTISPTTFKLQQYNKKTKRWKTIPATMDTISSNGETTTMTIDPFGATEGSSETPLAANKKFRGLVTTGATDLAGNTLQKNFFWTFKTGST